MWRSCVSTLKRSVAFTLLVMSAVAGAETSKLLPVSKDTLKEVRAAFNAGDRGPRVVVFLSSGCAACVPAAKALQALVEAQPGPVTVLVVWDPVVSALRKPPGAEVLGLLTDPRVQQLWDPGHLMSAEAARMVDGQGAHVPQARLRTDEKETGILYDTIVVFPPGVRWDDRLPAPVYFDGGFEAKKAELRKRLEDLLRAPK